MANQTYADMAQEFPGLFGMVRIEFKSKIFSETTTKTDTITCEERVQALLEDVKINLEDEDFCTKEVNKVFPMFGEVQSSRRGDSSLCQRLSMAMCFVRVTCVLHNRA